MAVRKVFAAPRWIHGAVDEYDRRSSEVAFGERPVDPAFVWRDPAVAALHPPSESGGAPLDRDRDHESDLPSR